MILGIACEGYAAGEPDCSRSEPGVTERPLASGKRAPLGIAALAAIGGRALARGGGVQPMRFKMKRRLGVAANETRAADARARDYACYISTIDGPSGW